MKFNEIMEKEEQEKGTYAGVRFCDETKKRINTFIEENEIPQPVPDEKLHTTLLYSRKYLPDFKPRGRLETPMVGTPTQFDVWESQPDDDGNKSNCLVLEYDCPTLSERHKSLTEEHGATFDFDEYKPHVTLSYNIDDMDTSQLDPSSVGELNLIEEYGEELKFDWAKENT